MSTDPNIPIPLPGTDILPLPGSEKKPVPGAHSTGPTHPEELVNVTLRLRARDGMKASGSDIREVLSFATDAGLKIVSSSAEERNVKLSGSVAQMKAAFGTELANYQAPPDADNPAGFNYRGRVGSILLPRHLVTDDDGTPIVEGVFGLDDRPVAKPHFKRPHAGVVAHAGATGFLATQLSRIYNFPSGGGAGQIGKVISLGGMVYPADVAAYCQEAGISPVPPVIVVPIDGYRPSPSDADVENALDVQTIIGGAPKIKCVVIYQAPNTDAGFLDALTAAVHDTTYPGGQIDISWGGPEQNWTPSAMRAFAGVITEAKQLGIPVVPAAGDNGSRDGTGRIMGDFPSTAPDALAAGGTRLIASGTTVVSEDAWSDTGGAPSSLFPMPAYQQGLAPGIFRCACDVAAPADPATGYVIYCTDQTGSPQRMVIGGTSGAAPFWVACLACVNANLPKPIPNIHALVYQPGVCRDITSGSNGDFNCAVGYDIPTGMGVPDGMKLLAAAQGVTVPPVVPPVNPPQPPTVITQAQVKRIIDGVFSLLLRYSLSGTVRGIIQQAKTFVDVNMAGVYQYLQSIGAV